MEEANEIDRYGSGANKVLRLLSAVLCILIVAASLAMLARVLWSGWTVGRDPSEYMVVSSRPQAEDADIVRAAQSSKRLKYLRSTAPFAQALANSLPGHSAAGLRVYRFKDRVAQQQVNEPNVDGFVRTQRGLEFDMGFLPWIGIAALLGTAVGLAWVTRPEMTRPLVAAAAGIAVAKALTQCGTCASVTIGGIDVAILGTALYALLLGASLASRSVAVQRSVLVVMGCVALWQLSTAWAMRYTCLPCSCLAFVSAFGLVSSLQWTAERRIASIRVPSTAWGAACVPMLSVLLGGTDPLSAIGEGPSGSASWGALPQDVKSLRDLGLPGFNHRVVLYVGKAGCHPCAQSLAAIDAAGIPGMTFASVGPERPDAKRPWLPLPNYRPIRETPSILFAAADGSVVAQNLGVMTDVQSLVELSREVKQFLSTAAPRGKDKP